MADAAVVALVPRPSGKGPSGPTERGDGGYWIVTAEGSVYSFGDAVFFGSIPGLRAAGIPVDPGVVVVAAVGTPGGHGYWLVDEHGGVFTFGDARFAGSLPALRAAGVPVGTARVVAMGVTPTGGGYFLVDEHGGVFNFGDAGFLGSVPTLRAAGVPVGTARVVAAAATPTGNGYWLVDELGGVFAFGDAAFFGSAARERLTEPVVGFAATTSGYRLLTADGRVRSYGGAPDHGSAVVQPAESALAIASSPTGGYWVVTPHDRPVVGAPPLPAASGSGRRIVYSNSRQRVWLVEATGVVTGTWAVSGRRGVPSPGTYRVFSKSAASTAHGGSLRLAHMVRFARGQRLPIGFHAIPTAGGRPIQGVDELGQYRSAGCVRQAPSDAVRLYAWAPLGTTVVVTP